MLCGPQVLHSGPVTIPPGLSGILNVGPPIEPRAASSVLVIDHRARPWTVLMMRRPRGADFAPGAHVFPGGSRHAEDDAYEDPDRAPRRSCGGGPDAAPPPPPRPGVRGGRAHPGPPDRPPPPPAPRARAGPLRSGAPPRRLRLPRGRTVMHISLPPGGGG